MKVLLLNPPFSELVIRDNYCCFTTKGNYLWAPSDLLAQSGILAARHKLSAIDAVAERLSPDETVKRIVSLKPDAIISMTGTATFPQDTQFFTTLNQHWQGQLLLMGNIAAYEPDRVFQALPQVNGIIHNFTTHETVDYLEGKRKKFAHLSYRKKNGTVHKGDINYHAQHTAHVSYGLPQHQLFPSDKYATPFMQQRPLSTVMISFGCPFSCKFCIASTLRFFKRSLIELEKEFNHLKRIGVRELFFQDSTFNADKEFCIAVCALLSKPKYNFTWSANVHSACLDRERIEWMKKGGCHTLNIGVENAAETILQSYYKGTNISRLKQAFRDCQEVGIQTMGYFIIGLPEDTPKTINSTIRFAQSLNPTFASFSIATADYGTAMYNELSAAHRVIEQDSFDSSAITNIKHPILSHQQLKTFTKQAYLSFYFRPSKLFELLSLSVKNGTVLTNLIGGLMVIKKMILQIGS